MNLQRRLAGKILKCGPSRIRLDPERMTEITEAITKFDIKQLVSKGAIRKVPVHGASHLGARLRQTQRRRGRRRGHGSRKGGLKARQEPKKAWMNNIRAQRRLLHLLRDNKMITTTDYHSLYSKAHGGFFRSTRHVKTYLKEQGMIRK